MSHAIQFVAEMASWDDNILWKKKGIEMAGPRCHCPQLSLANGRQPTQLENNIYIYIYTHIVYIYIVEINNSTSNKVTLHCTCCLSTATARLHMHKTLAVFHHGPYGRTYVSNHLDYKLNL